jgi:RpiR family transcriptional regulator, carbohydrate utilization regulator
MEERAHSRAVVASGASVLARLQTLVPNLRDAERKIADYVLSHPEDVIYMSITELADRTDTSEASVIRFAQRLGYAGYAALKIALTIDRRDNAAPLPSDLGPGADIASLKHTILRVNGESLKDTAELLDDTALSNAVEALVGARRIDAYGIGGSAVVVHDAYFMLMQIGLPIVAIADPHLQMMSAVQLTTGDVALAISLSGSTRDTIEALQAARDAGATCLCITRYARSPITRVAHITLLAAARPATVGGHNLLGRVAQLAVIDVLAAAVMLARGKASIETLERGRRAISASKKL